MAETALRKVVIVGGGAAGWMAAAVLGGILEPVGELHLIESAESAGAGSEEGTLPSVGQVNRMLGLDEDALMRRTGATFRLGTKFVNWERVGHSYFHTHGALGADIGALDFPHYWRRLSVALGEAAGSLGDYSFSTLAALSRKFSRPDPDSPAQLPRTPYGLHLDADRYALRLRRRAEKSGVRRHAGRAVCGELDERGFVAAVRLEDGRRIEGDLFIDCTRDGLLIERTLGGGFEDWTRWLPCDRAVVTACARIEDPTPYTRATAHRAGWQWRVPLQDRTGNGHVYCSAFVDDEEALQTLLANLDGEMLGEPVSIRLTAGRRERFWIGNVVALGPAAGHLEPLEGTRLHLVQSAIARLIQLFPDREFRQPDVDLYNRLTASEHERIRDFLIVHYHATGRCEPFWTQCRTMDLPATLAERLELYRGRGRILPSNEEPFGGDSWAVVLEGQGIRPERYHPLAEAVPLDTLRETLASLRESMLAGAGELPSHADFIREHCAFKPQAGPPQARAASTVRL